MLSYNLTAVDGRNVPSTARNGRHVPSTAVTRRKRPQWERYSSLLLLRAVYRFFVACW